MFTLATYRLWYKIKAVCFRQQPLCPATNVNRHNFLRVFIVLPGFPVTGGTYSVLSRIALVTKDSWQIEYLVQHVGPKAEGFTIHRFGTRRTVPWYFPAVWLYSIAGFCKLIALLRSGVNYDLILVQDGIYTAAFGAVVAKLAGIRCVCIDHGNLSLLKSRAYRIERLNALKTRNWDWFRHLLARLQYKGYWPSLYLLARFAACFVDQYFIPGVAGDGVEEICQSLGVPPSHIVRFANMIEVERHPILPPSVRATMREHYGIAADSVVIAIICRLAPEKGLEIALPAISQALATLSPDLSKSVRIIIAGDGPLRQHIEVDIERRGLQQACLLWGEATKEEVITILGLSDLFLFTSWRAAGYPLAVLEAMASACAVIAATESLATREMLSDGRGIVLPVGDRDGVADAIVQLVNNTQLRQKMGSLAREYVAVEHSAEKFKRALMSIERQGDRKGTPLQ